jgi:hypothetical protein
LHYSSLELHLYKDLVGIGDVMRKLLVMIMLVALFSVVYTSVAAQEEPEECDAEGAITAITEIAADTKIERLDILRAIRDAVTKTLIECEGLSFSSTDDGKQPVLGPITIPEGLWRITVDTTGYFQLSFDVLEGTCEGDGFSQLLFNEFEGEAINAQTLFTSEGCEVLFTVDNVSEDWELSFEKLR